MKFLLLLVRSSKLKARANDIMMIVLGNNDGDRGQFLVVTPADAARLQRAGYELA